MEHREAAYDFKLDIGNTKPDMDAGLEQLRKQRIIQRIWEHDHTVWKEKPDEITNRLGWLYSPEVMQKAIPAITAFVDDVRSKRFTHALLLGMGGSSLAPEVFRYTFGVKEGYLDLAVLDSTHPSSVLSYAKTLDPQKTLYIVSTKSGGTVETLSFMKYFYTEVLQVAGRENAGKHFVAITDPGSKLEETARELKFREIFLNDPNIGGRYSALSYFGLVPAAIIGMDLNRLLKSAEKMARRCRAATPGSEVKNPGAWLGTVMGNYAKDGRDKITLIASPGISCFGAWVEQLIAESTGKDGKGILPVDGETIEEPQFYANDRLFVYSHLRDDSIHDQKIDELSGSGQPVVRLNVKKVYDLGGEFFRWEFATAIAGYFLKINPFDQPNVESAKVLAREMVAAYRKEGKLPASKPIFSKGDIHIYGDDEITSLPDAFQKFFSNLNPGDEEARGRSYVSLQAYLQPTTEINILLQKFREKIQRKYRVATTVGYGPRFLHSTGQLHKGDGGNGLFIQLTAGCVEDAGIPDEPGGEASSISFCVLLQAQALGDRQALLNENRKVLRFHFSSSPSSDLEKIIELLN
ncbi:MAG: glucose-6-phosphate isomerase [Calditrichia bacterium]